MNIIKIALQSEMNIIRIGSISGGFEMGSSHTKKHSPQIIKYVGNMKKNNSWGNSNSFTI